MAQVPMTDAVAGGVALSAEYNKVIDNIQDLAAIAYDTATSPGGIGNQRLADRFGSGVGTGSNVTTGSATSQLTDLRSRVTTLEGGVPAADAVSLRRVASHNISNATDTVFLWDTEDYDSGSMWASGSAGNIVVPRNGLYDISATILLDPTGTGQKTLYILKNATAPAGDASATLAAGRTDVSGGGAVTMFAQVTSVPLASGDIVRVVAFQNTGATRATIHTFAGHPRFGMHLVRAT